MSALRNIIKHYMPYDVYPLVGVVTVALSIGVMTGSRALANNPDVTVNKERPLPYMDLDPAKMNKMRRTLDKEQRQTQ
jgi:hypothetical protein